MVACRKRIRLVHWNEDEVPERARRLEDEGFEVDGAVPGTSIGVKQLREDPPIAVVIDLGRLPLAQKLGVKPGSTIALVDPPDGIEKKLAPLPESVTLRHGNRGAREMTIWFVTARSEYQRRFAAVAKAVGEGTLWMAWAKRSSGVETDLTEDDAIRDVALPAGMVDTKVCAIDETRSGLRLTQRRT